MDTVFMIAHHPHDTRRTTGEEDEEDGVKSEKVYSTAISRISGYTWVKICSSML